MVKLRFFCIKKLKMRFYFLYTKLSILVKDGMWP